MLVGISPNTTSVGAIRNKDELIRCWGQKVKVKVTSTPHENGKISTQLGLGDIFSPISGMHYGHILIKVADYQVHMTRRHFQGDGFKGQCYRQHFLQRGIFDDTGHADSIYSDQTSCTLGSFRSISDWGRSKSCRLRSGLRCQLSESRAPMGRNAHGDGLGGFASPGL